MDAWIQSVVILVSGAALLAGFATLLATSRPLVALKVLLDLLLAAGLLRLALPPTWPRLLTAAVVVALRHLLVYGLGRSAAPPGLRGS